VTCAPEDRNLRPFAFYQIDIYPMGVDFLGGPDAETFIDMYIFHDIAAGSWSNIAQNVLR
jgi:hypothetical protein